MNIRNDNFKHHLKYVGFISTLFSLCLMSCNKANKTYDVKSYRTCMNFHDDFKILQITDTHLGLEVDLNHEMNIVTNYMLEADPDLVIFTGDNFTYASKGIVKEFIKRVNDTCLYLNNSHPNRLTKFALTYGNHDNQGDFPRYFINHVIKEYVTTDGKEKEDNKFAAFIDFDDDNVYGLTNYYIDLVDDISKSNETVDVIYRLHIIDSNTYHFNGVKYKYDCIHDDQLDHVLNVYNNATTDKDYIGMAFFHIPFEEFQMAKEQYENSSNKEIIGQGTYLEDALYPYKNNDSYQKLKEANIISFVCGHNHKINSDVLYNATSSDINEKAILSFGVKATTELYHSKDLIGYKIINLKKDMSKENFLSIENINNNFINVTDRYSEYE